MTDGYMSDEEIEQYLLANEGKTEGTNWDLEDERVIADGAFFELERRLREWNECRANDDDPYEGPLEEPGALLLEPDAWKAFERLAGLTSP